MEPLQYKNVTINNSSLKKVKIRNERASYFTSRQRHRVILFYKRVMRHYGVSPTFSRRQRRFASRGHFLKCHYFFMFSYLFKRPASIIILSI